MNKHVFSILFIVLSLQTFSLTKQCPPLHRTADQKIKMEQFLDNTHWKYNKHIIHPEDRFAEIRDQLSSIRTSGLKYRPYKKNDSNDLQIDSLSVYSEKDTIRHIFHYAPNTFTNITKKIFGNDSYDSLRETFVIFDKGQTAGLTKYVTDKKEGDVWVPYCRQTRSYTYSAHSEEEKDIYFSESIVRETFIDGTWKFEGSTTYAFLDLINSAGKRYASINYCSISGIETFAKVETLCYSAPSSIDSTVEIDSSLTYVIRNISGSIRGKDDIPFILSRGDKQLVSRTVHTRSADGVTRGERVDDLLEDIWVTTWSWTVVDSGNGMTTYYCTIRHEDGTMVSFREISEDITSLSSVHIFDELVDGNWVHHTRNTWQNGQDAHGNYFTAMQSEEHWNQDHWEKYSLYTTTTDQEGKLSSMHYALWYDSAWISADNYLYVLNDQIYGGVNWIGLSFIAHTVNIHYHDGLISFVQQSGTILPREFVLEQNFPNPFNPSTELGFTLQVSGITTLKVYDALGREVTTLVNEYLEAGVYHERTFDASYLASGMYFARLTSGGASQMKKLMLLK